MMKMCVIFFYIAFVLLCEAVFLCPFKTPDWPSKEQERIGVSWQADRINRIKQENIMNNKRSDQLTTTQADTE